VKRPVGQAAHLGMAALLAGVLSQGVRQGYYLTKGSQHRPAHGAGAGGTPGRVLTRRLEFARLAKGTD
jgi:hypothetical protein